MFGSINVSFENGADTCSAVYEAGWEQLFPRTQMKKKKKKDKLEVGFKIKFIPKALNVAMCSHMFSGCSGWGWTTMASTSYRKQRHGISDGFTATVNKYWLLPRFI